MASDKIVQLTAQNFGESIASGTTLVDFWAGWCRPCKMIAPIVDQIADEYADKLAVAKVDIDAHGALAQQFGVMSIPTLMLFQNGVPVDTIIGVVPKAEIASMIARHIG